MSNNKQIAKNMIYNLISFAINLGISFFFTPYLIRVVGKEAYGFYPLANSFIGYTSIITTAIGSMSGRFITMKLYNNELDKAKVYFNSTLVAYSLISLIITILSIPTIIYLNYFLTIPSELIFDVKLLFALTFFCTIISLPFGILGTGVFVKNRLDVNASKTVITNVVRVILIISLFYFFKPSITYIGVSSVLCTILWAYYNISFKKVFLPEIEINPRKYFSWGAVKELTSSGMWNSFNQLSIILMTQVDLWITNLFIGAAATGDFSIAKIVPSLIQSVVGVLVGVFVPHFTILYAQRKQKELLLEISKSIKLMGLFVTLPIAFLLINGKEFFDLWVPGQDSETLYWLSNLSIIPMIVTGSINTIYNVYTVTNKLKIPSIVWFVLGVLNVFIVILLLKYTSLGLWAIPITALVMGLLRNLLFTPIYAAHCLGVKNNTFYKAIFNGVICTIVVMIVSFAIKQFIALDSWWSFITSAILTTIIALSINIYIILNKNEVNSLREIINSKLIEKYDCRKKNRRIKDSY